MSVVDTVMTKLKGFMRNCILTYYHCTRNKDARSVYIASFSGQYCDSPRAIAEELYKLDPTVHQIWETAPGAYMPTYVEKAITHKERLRARAQSKVWVLGMGTDWKPKDVMLVATWHGDRGFKKILLATPLDAPETSRGKQIIKANKNIDIYTSGSAYGEMQAREGLGYEGYIQAKGLPRNDMLVNHLMHQDEILNIKKNLSIPEDAKILLFAPTFRDSDTGKQVVGVDIQTTLQILQKKYPKWIVIIRAHKCSNGLDFPCGENFIDLSSYGDMRDLLLIADCLITDYSSSAGDFVLTGRPCVLTHYDREEYETSSRELWFEPEQSGFIIAQNNEQLYDIMEHLDEYDHEEISGRVLKFYGTYESGQSSKITAEKIIDWVNRK